MIKVRNLAESGLVERLDGWAAWVSGVRVGGARRLWFHVERRIEVAELAKIVVKGTVLLHQDDDMVDGNLGPDLDIAAD